MITITPQTSIYLCKTPLTSDYQHQLKFNNITAQSNYFRSKIAFIETDYTYVKKDNQIYINKNIDEIIKCNYLYYKNIGFTNKTYYCFITNMEYINENCTLLTIETDVIQTYQFDINYKPCFVEREHVNDDTIGKNLTPENLETGEFIESSSVIDTTFNELGLIVASPYDLDYIIEHQDTTVSEIPVYTGTYNGLPSGMGYYLFENSASVLNTLLKLMADLGISDSIICMFVAPTIMLTTIGSGKHRIVNTSSIYTKTYGVSPIRSIDGYTPKNNKLLTFPFSYIEITNHVGQSAIIKQEYWKLNNNNEMEIKGVATLTPGMSIKMYPKNYKKDADNYDEGITIGKFPQVPWINDLYTNWMTQNGINLGFKTLNSRDWAISGGLIQSGVGIIQSSVGATESGVNNAIGGIGNIWNQMQAEYQHQFNAYQLEGSLNTGDVATAGGFNCMEVNRMTITSEFARKIDSFFSMFGYKINDVKIPNLTGRRNWNYIKTDGCNFTGEIPNEDLLKIRRIFDNGITLWHNPNNIFNYSLENDII